MSHVFISYAHNDWPFADLVKNELEKERFSVWIDTEKLKAGRDWREDIDRAIIDDCFALIVIMTPEADKSKYVTYEWACAWGARKFVIPLVLKHTELHPRLGVLQYLDFSNPQTRSWTKLIELIREIQSDYEERQNKRKSRKATPANNSLPLNPALPVQNKNATPNSVGIYLTEQLESLIKTLRNSISSRERIKAVNSLGLLAQDGNEEALLGLFMAADDNDYDVRKAAARALGETGNAAVVARLAQLLYDSNVNTTAVKALESIGTPEALAAIKKWRGF